MGCYEVTSISTLDRDRHETDGWWKGSSFKTNVRVACREIASVARGFSLGDKPEVQSVVIFL